MTDFEICFNKTITLEGGYVLHNIKGDTGGMTYAGISSVHHPTWPGWAHLNSDQNILELLVKDFYESEFWDKIRGNDIISNKIAFQIYDFAVNAGIRTSVKIAQRIINTDIDGIIGNKTIEALNNYNEDLFELKFSLLKVFRYKDICLRDKRRNDDFVISNLKFLCGWINRVENGMDIS